MHMYVWVPKGYSYPFFPQCRTSWFERGHRDRRRNSESSPSPPLLPREPADDQLAPPPPTMGGKKGKPKKGAQTSALAKRHNQKVHLSRNGGSLVAQKGEYGANASRQVVHAPAPEKKSLSSVS